LASNCVDGTRIVREIRFQLSKRYHIQPFAAKAARVLIRAAMKKPICSRAPRLGSELTSPEFSLLSVRDITSILEDILFAY
jgi:hypothetical protein